MQVCISLQTDNHASTPPLKSFLQAGCPSCRPTNSIKALKAWTEKLKLKKMHCYLSKLTLLITGIIIHYGSRIKAKVECLQSTDPLTKWNHKVFVGEVGNLHSPECICHCSPDEVHIYSDGSTDWHLMSHLTNVHVISENRQCMQHTPIHMHTATDEVW